MHTENTSKKEIIQLNKITIWTTQFDLQLMKEGIMLDIYLNGCHLENSWKNRKKNVQLVHISLLRALNDCSLPQGIQTVTNLNYTSAIQVLFKIQRRRLKASHSDDHYCCTHFTYFKEEVVEQREIVISFFFK